MRATLWAYEQRERHLTDAGGAGASSDADMRS